MKSFKKENLESLYSDSFENVDPSNEIHNIEITYQNTRTKQIILDKLMSSLKGQKTFGGLFNSLIETTSSLSTLNIYKSINVKLLPGKSIDNVHILFDFKEKSKFFASLSHYIETRSSEATLNSKLGFRNILGFAEKYTLEFEKALDKSKKSAFDFTFELPYFYRDFSLQAGYIEGKKLLTTNIHENFDSHFFKLFLDKEKNTSISLENSLRTNHIKPKNVSEEVLLNEIFPSRKIGLKYWWVHENSLKERNNKTKGNYIDNTVELTLPGSDTYFVKFEHLRRNFFHIHKLKKILPTKLYKNINFENNFYVSFIQSLNKNPIRINDRIEAINLRGFQEIGTRKPPQNLIQHPHVGENGYEALGDLIGNHLFLKNTHKINFYNYPFLKNGNIIPFFHLTSLFLHNKNESNQNDEGFFRRSLNFIQDNTRFSFGMGISASVGMGAKIEVLYNMLHLNKKSDIPNNFQIRLTLND